MKVQNSFFPKEKYNSPRLTGVRQGENVCIFLFSVFLNDLEDYFKTLDGVPLEKLKERFYNEMHILYELFVILYADATVLMSETLSTTSNFLSCNINE
jgi:hypothetical protein